MHFLLLGAGLFALHDHLQPDRTRTTIEVSAEMQKALVQEFRDRHGRAPTDAQRAELVREHVDRQLWYREGLARGLDRGDPIVRRRIVQKMQFLAETATTPDERALQAFFSASGQRYRRPRTFSFKQIFVGEGREGRAALPSIIDALEAGTDPGSLGKPFPHGQTFEGMTRSDIEARFGPAFADGIAKARIGQWQPLRSSLGWHGVRVAESDPGEIPALEQVRRRVEADFRREHQAELRRQALDDLRERYEVSIAPFSEEKPQ